MILPFFLSSLGSLKADGSTVIARIGRTEVHAGELQPLLARLDPQEEAALAKDPERLLQLVRSILIQRMVLQEALAKKWDQQPEVAAEVRLARENKIVDTYLQSVSKVPDSYPSAAEVKSAYEASKPRLQTVRQYRLAQIFVAAPPGTEPGLLSLAQTRMEDIQNELQKPNANFAALATTRSDDKVSAAKGGELGGWVTESQVEATMRSQLINLPKGGVSPPVRLPDGWHFLKCLDIKDPYTLSLAEVEPQLVQELRAEKQRELEKDYVEKMAASSPLTLVNSALPEVLKK